MKGLVAQKRLILTLTSGFLLLLSSATLNHTDVLASQGIQNTALIQAASASVLSSNATVDKPITLEQYVENYYKDTPILAKISGCESQFHQFTKSGDVIRGKVDPDDIGIMQINERYNGETAKNLGYDIYTLDGNLAFGKWLYDHEGTDPWSASKSCWSK